MSKITKINKWFTHHTFLCQSVVDKPSSGFSVTFKCRSWIVCDDSSSSWVTGDQALHHGTKVNNSFQRSENHTQDGFVGRKDNGLTSGHFTEVKAHRTQTFVDSGCPQWRHHVTRKSWDTSQSPQMFSRSSFRLQCWVNIFQRSTFSRIILCLRYSNSVQV